MSLVNTTGPAPAPPFNQALAGESNLGRILGVQTTVLALGLIVVSARVYARIFVVKAFGKDDACMVLAAVCGTPRLWGLPGLLTDYHYDRFAHWEHGYAS